MSTMHADLCLIILRAFNNVIKFYFCSSFCHNYISCSVCRWMMWCFTAIHLAEIPQTPGIDQQSEQRNSKTWLFRRKRRWASSVQYTNNRKQEVPDNGNACINRGNCRGHASFLPVARWVYLELIRRTLCRCFRQHEKEDFFLSVLHLPNVIRNQT